MARNPQPTQPTLYVISYHDKDLEPEVLTGPEQLAAVMCLTPKGAFNSIADITAWRWDPTTNSYTASTPLPPPPTN